MKRGVALLLSLAFASAAQAHALRLNAEATGEGVSGLAHYSDGSPARSELVYAYDQAAQQVARVRTDSDGRFLLPLTRAGRYRIVVEGEEGHRAELQLSYAPPDSALATALRAELAPLREDIARLQQRTALADIVGGLGFIAGLFGAVAFWLARRPRATERR
ncbi:carboxypeptidase-like regulatory domain-containing protein [Solimonas aquatica]|uniref:carboxypeptidase-like regulatory domain-containing protein n=1 Tax=Solimonas aquatica TaxID=489703 RepID=UPI000B88D81B|nr:carboxypeptidase-like regulatory domain-containing protein [Solimonas aquatica]